MAAAAIRCLTLRSNESLARSSRNCLEAVFSDLRGGLSKNCCETAIQQVTNIAIPVIPYTWDNLARRMAAANALPSTDSLSRTEADMSTKTDQQKKKLQAFAKRRAKRPEPIVTPIGSMKAGNAVERRLVQNHADLLQSIEYALVSAASESHEFDDHYIERVLRHTITQRPSDDPLIGSVVESLTEIRRLREEVPDDLWNDAIRVVHTSLKRHSNCEPGETSYLRFVSRYVG